MLTKIDLGEVWLPQELIDRINIHKSSILDENKHAENFSVLVNAPFSAYFSDYIVKNFSIFNDN